MVALSILDQTSLPSPSPLVPLAQRSDEHLVEFALAGDDEAFSLLVGRYEEAFVRAARRIVKDEADARDVVQTALLNMYRKLETFEVDSNFRSWAYRVVTNQALMLLRKRRTRGEVALECAGLSGLDDTTFFDLSVAPAWSARADRELETKQICLLIQSAVDALEPKYRSVFGLREFEHMSLHEIAEALDLSVPAVKSRLHRARHMLRISLAPHLIET